MKLQPRYGFACAACALLCSTGLAQTPPNAGVLGMHEQILARFERLPEHRLKALFLRCSRDATQRLLGLDEGALCSMAQDTLKKRTFGGSFEALLEWWRVHRDDPDDAGHGASNAPTEASGPSR